MGSEVSLISYYSYLILYFGLFTDKGQLGAEIQRLFGKRVSRIGWLNGPALVVDFTRKI